MTQRFEQEPRVPGLQGLAREHSPDRDLWPGIAGRLRRRPRPAPLLALAASLVLGVAALLFLGVPPDGPLQTAASQSLAADDVVIIQANLDIVRDAQDRLQAALAVRPDSRELQGLLALTRRQHAYLQQLLS